MSSEDHKNMKKIQCWIPSDTWDKIVSLGYTSPTIAVTKAFEELLEDPQKDPHTNTLRSPQNPHVSREIPIESPNIPYVSPEIPELKARIEELKDHNETLKSLLERSSQEKEFIHNLYNNYMLQVQSLINQKAIAPPAKEEKSSSQREDKAATKQNEIPSPMPKKTAPKEDIPAQKAEKTLLEKICKNCNQMFFTENKRKETCSGKCRVEYSRKKAMI
jgi:hypothetical protein